MPLDLDERLGIQVQAYDVERSPWRSDGARWYVSGGLSASAGNFSRLSVGSAAANAGAVHVIDGVWLTNTGAALIDVNLGFSFGAAPTFVRFARTSELGNPLGTTGPEVQYRLGPCALLSSQIAVQQVTNPDITITIPANTTIYVPLEVTIINAATGINSYDAETGAVNLAFRASWTGRTWARAPQNQP